MDERHFASDNNAGAHPEIIAALAAANRGHVGGYGDDPTTARAEAAFRTICGEQARVFFTFGGTGANVVALTAALRPHQAVIVPRGAHLDVDECGAYERIGGGKLLVAPAVDGKLTPDGIAAHWRGIGDPHHVQPAAISISQTTEVGTAYRVDELQALGEIARRRGLLFHVDGARIANAAASLGVDLRTMLVDTGVDVLTFGGTKNGLVYGEAIVVLHDHPALAVLPYARKAGMQLPSKMRFIAAQFEALLRDDLWLRSAAHANRMARRLAERVTRIEGVRLAYPVEANGVFAVLPRAAIAPLQRVRRFYVWDDAASVVRWMTAFDTTEADVDAFADAVAAAVGAGVAV